MFSKPVLIKSISMMLLVVITALFVLAPVYFKVLRAERNKFIDEHQNKFARSVDLLDKSIKDSQQLVSLLNNSYSFQRFKSMEKTQGLNYYAKLNDATTAVQNTFRTTNSDVTSFIYVSTNDSIIANALLSDAASDFFSKKIVFADWEPDDVISSIMIEDSLMAFLPEHSVSIMGAEDDYLPYLYRGITDSSVLCVLFKADLISDWFNLDQYRDTDYFFRLVESNVTDDDIVLLERSNTPEENNKKTQDYTIFKLKLANVNYECIMGVSNNYYADHVRPLKILLIITVISSIIIAGLVSYILATRSYRPLHELVSLSTTEEQQDFRKENEYSFVQRYIERICQSNLKQASHIAALYNEKRCNTLVRLSLDYPQQELDLPDEINLLPQLNNNFHISVVAYNKSSETVVKLLTKGLSVLPSNLFCVARLKKKQLIILLPEISGLINILEKALKNVRNTYDASVCAGLSLTCHSISELQTGLFQAQNALDAKVPLSIFSSLKNIEKHQFKVDDLTQFINYILTADKENALLTIASLAAISSKNINNAQTMQSYYLVRSAIEHAGSLLNCQDLGQAWDSNGKTFNDLISDLSKVTEGLCLISQELINAGNQALKQDIVKFVDQNFQSPDLTGLFVAEHFKISDKYVFRLFKEQTGYTLNKYVESLRMELAMHNIENTNMSVAKVAYLSGYSTSSNFSKAFKKYYGQSPSFFRRIKTATELE